MTRRGKIVVVVCGVLVAMAAACAMIIRGLPPVEITFEVDETEHATIGARNAVVSLGSHDGIRWPYHAPRAQEIISQFTRLSRKDYDGLPTCRVVAQFAPTALADGLVESVIVTRNCYAYLMRLRCADVSVDVILPKWEGWNAIPAFGKPRDLTLVYVRPPPEGGTSWDTTTAALRGVIPVPNTWERRVREAKRDAAKGIAWKVIRERSLVSRERAENCVMVDVQRDSLDCMSREEWKETLARAHATSRAEHDRPSNIDMSSADAVCVACDQGATACDIVRLLDAIRDRPSPVKACLVGNVAGLP